eukprot:759180-Hanusia_phi.AAC.1
MAMPVRHRILALSSKLGPAVLSAAGSPSRRGDGAVLVGCRIFIRMRQDARTLREPRIIGPPWQGHSLPQAFKA